MQERKKIQDCFGAQKCALLDKLFYFPKQQCGAVLYTVGKNLLLLQSGGQYFWDSSVPDRPQWMAQVHLDAAATWCIYHQQPMGAINPYFTMVTESDS